MRSPLFAPLFIAFSALWSLVNAGARWAARRGWIRRRKLDSRVVSVGNLQAGGAGKTPIVAEIAREAVRRGKQVCILSRGYGGRWERDGGVIRPGETGVRAELAGDEPALLHELCPEAWIGVGARRALQYEKVRSELGRAPDLVVLDDGFQQFRLARDVELVAVTARSRRDTLFREFPSALRHADLVLWTKGARPPVERAKDVEVRFAVRSMSHAGEIPRPEELELGLRPRLWLVTGVADGEQVRRSLEEEGVEVERHVRFPDHARYDETMIRDLVSDARRNHRKVGVTGKDWMKWRDRLGEEERGSVLVFEPVLEFVRGRERWEAVLWGR